MLPILLALLLSSPGPQTDGALLTRDDGSLSTDQDRCAEELVDFVPEGYRVCIDRSEPILWSTRYGSEGAAWRGLRMPLPAGFSAADISRFASLGPASVLLSGRAGELYGWKGDDFVRLEDSGVGELEAVWEEEIAYYHAVQQVEGGAQLHRLRKVGGDLTVETWWESTDREVVRFWADSRMVQLTTELDGTLESWERSHDGAEWRLTWQGEPPTRPAPLAEWVEVAPYPADSAARGCANRSPGLAWEVFATGLGPEVRRFEYSERLDAVPFWIRPGKGRVSAIRVDDGYLVGFDKGEFGGSIRWYSDDGRDSYRVAEHNTRGFATTPGAIVAITGLAHLTFDRGALVRLTRNPGERWQVAEEIDLGAAPESFLQEASGSLTILTSEGLLSYRGGTVEAVHPSENSLLAPNSILRTADGDLYVGMRHVVARLSPQGAGYRETWLAPPDCPRLVPTTGWRCDCAEMPATEAPETVPE